jgi:hypothetical protein
MAIAELLRAGDPRRRRDLHLLAFVGKLSAFVGDQI